MSYATAGDLKKERRWSRSGPPSSPWVKRADSVSGVTRPQLPLVSGQSVPRMRVHCATSYSLDQPGRLARCTRQ